MASIQYKKERPYLVYDDPKCVGKRRQVWQEIEDGKDPEIALAEFNVKLLKGKVISPSNETVEQFIPRWVEVYAPENWGFSMYKSSLGLLQNHVIDEIGFMKIKNVKSIDIEKLIARLRVKKCKGPKSYNRPASEIPCLSSTTVREIHGLLIKIFDKAVEWKIIEENPVTCKRPEKAKNNKRGAWSSRNTLQALIGMEDDAFLHLAVHTAFACSLRNGEAMGITLDCINLDDNYIVIDKTLQRVDLVALDIIPDDELIFVFPQKVKGKKSTLILKKPKTDSSSRIVYMTSQLRSEIIKRLDQIAKNKEFYGDRYAQYDYELLFSQDDGSPVEPKLCEKRFKRWQAKAGMEIQPLDFHGIRHSSITYKVKLSGGDLSTVKGDSGHSTVQMVGSYADHIFDEERKELTQAMEDQFYSNDQSEGWIERRFSMLLEQMIFLAEKDPSLLKKARSAMFARVAD